MATAVVFVDDAVRGDLPPVCAKTGAATADHLTMTVPVGGSEGFGIAWLLVLAGPIGWLGLFIYGLVRRVETLVVRLPYSDAAYNELTKARRTRRLTGLASVSLLVIALLVAKHETFSAHAVAAALGTVVIGVLLLFVREAFHVRRATVRVELDGSRRWVTLSRVHDSFAEAIRRLHADNRSPSLEGSSAP